MTNDSGIFKEVQIPVGALSIAFTYRFTSGNEDDHLVVTAGSNAVPVAIENLPLYQEAAFEGRLNVAHLGGTTQTLEFRLAGIGEANTSVEVTKISFIISSDVDHDGLTNDEELALGTNPLNADSDLDGLNDSDEVNVHTTNPNNSDTDDDGVSDGAEVAAGTDPNNASSRPPTPTPSSAVSRKVHGTAGAFDINLPLTGNPGIECRSGQANGSHQVVITFPTAVTVAAAWMAPAAGKSGMVAGAPSSSPDGREVTVDLAGVSDAQAIILTLSGVDDGTHTGDVRIRMSVLAGDTTGNGSVNASDVGQVKSKSGQSVDGSNFRQDVNVNGALNASDVGLVKSKSGPSLP